MPLEEPTGDRVSMSIYIFTLCRYEIGAVTSIKYPVTSAMNCYLDKQTVNVACKSKRSICNNTGTVVCSYRY